MALRPTATMVMTARLANKSKHAGVRQRLDPLSSLAKRAYTTIAVALASRAALQSARPWLACLHTSPTKRGPVLPSALQGVYVLILAGVSLKRLPCFCENYAEGWSKKNV